MLDKKTKRKLAIEFMEDFNTSGTSEDESRVWVSQESLIKYLDSELNNLNIRLSNKELPYFCQANLSGGVIWLESLKEELKGKK